MWMCVICVCGGHVSPLAYRSFEMAEHSFQFCYIIRKNSKKIHSALYCTECP